MNSIDPRRLISIDPTQSNLHTLEVGLPKNADLLWPMEPSLPPYITTPFRPINYPKIPILIPPGEGGVIGYIDQDLTIDPLPAPSSQVEISASFDAAAPLYVQALDETTGAWVDVANNRGAPSVGLVNGDLTKMNLRVFRADTNEYFYRNTESSLTTYNPDGSITVAFEDWIDGDFNDAVVTLRGRNDVVAPPAPSSRVEISASFDAAAPLYVQAFDETTGAWVDVANNRGAPVAGQVNGDLNTMKLRVFRADTNEYFYRDTESSRTTINADGTITVAFEDWIDGDFNDAVVTLRGLDEEVQPPVVAPHHFTSMAEAAAYIMSYAKSGLMLDISGLTSALESFPADNQEYIPEIAAELMRYYGKDGSMDLSAVTAMMTEGVLSQQKNADGGGGFTFSFGTIPTERVVGHHDYDATSLGALFETLGMGSHSETQMQTLISIYGDGTSVNSDTILGAMKDDGFLTFAADLWGGATADWNKIDGARIVDTLFPEVSGGLLIPGDTGIPGVYVEDPDMLANLGVAALADVFENLFGYVEEQPLSYLTKRFGKDSRLSRATIADLFNSDAIALHVDDTTGHIGIDVLTGPGASSRTGSGVSDSLLMGTVIHLADFFDTNRDGVFSGTEGDLHRRILLDGTGIDQSTFAHLTVLYGNPADSTFVIEDFNQMLVDGALVPRGPDSSDFYLDLDLTKVPTERYVDAMFAHVGKNPATDSLTAQDFKDSFETVFGVPDWLEPPKTADGTSYPSEAAYLAQVNGTLGADGEYRMNHADIVDIFESKDIVLNSETRYISSVEKQFDVAKPAHHNSSWWDTLWGGIEQAAGDVIDTLSDIVGIAETDLANIFNGKMSIGEALTDAGTQIVDELYAAVERGEEEAIEVVEQIGAAIKTGVEELSDAGEAFIDAIVADVKAGGEKLAIQMLAGISGMTSEQAKEAIESAGAKMQTISNLSSASFDDMKAMIPDFDAMYAEALKIQREVLQLTGGTESEYDTTKAVTVDEMFSNLNAPERVGFRRKLLDQGFDVDNQGRLLTSTGTVATQAEKQTAYDTNIRLDFALEEKLGASGANSIASDSVQFRLFFTAPRMDENGQEFVEFRARELDYAAVAVGSGSTAGDAGLMAVRDIIVPFNAGTNVGERRDVTYASTTAIIAEYTPGVKLTSKEIKATYDKIQEFLVVAGRGNIVAPEPGIELQPVSISELAEEASDIDWWSEAGEGSEGGYDGDISGSDSDSEGSEIGSDAGEGSEGGSGAGDEAGSEIGEGGEAAAGGGEAAAGGGWERPPSKFGVGLEFGFGAGLTTTYNLTELGGGSWEPFVSEVGGALVGAGGTAAVLFGLDAVVDGGITEFIEQWGPTAVHAGAIAGAGVADLINAAAYDEVSTTFSGYNWEALVFSYNSDYEPGNIYTSAKKFGAAGRLRFQFNYTFGKPIKVIGGKDKDGNPTP